MANPKFVSSVYRLSDEKTRSYSLRERLGAGKFIFEESNSSKKKIKNWTKAWKNARAIVFKNHPYTRWEKRHEMGEIQALKSLRETSYWNPLGWLEAFTLAWANWATLRYNPLKNKPLSSTASYLHIMFASLMHAVAKTANLVLSPLAPILYIAACMTVGFLNPWVLSIFCVGTASFLGSMIYHGKRNAQARDEDDREPEHSLYGLVHAITAVISGVLNPFIRLWNKAQALWGTHPRLAVAAGITAFTLVLAIAVFPYVSLPAIAGFQFGTYIGAVITPLLQGFSTLLTTMGPVPTAMLSITTVAAVTVGVVDLTVRAFKEIAGWWDKGQAKSEIIENTGAQVTPIKEGTAGLVHYAAFQESSPKHALHFMYYRQYDLSKDGPAISNHSEDDALFSEYEKRKFGN